MCGSGKVFGDTLFKPHYTLANTMSTQQYVLNTNVASGYYKPLSTVNSFIHEYITGAHLDKVGQLQQVLVNDDRTSVAGMTFIGVGRYGIEAGMEM